MHEHMKLKERSLQVNYKVVQVGPEDPRRGKNHPVIKAFEKHQAFLTPGSTRLWAKQINDFKAGKTPNLLEVSIHDTSRNLVFSDEWDGVLVAVHKKDQLPRGIEGQYLVIEMNSDELLAGLEEAIEGFASKPKQNWFPTAAQVSFQLLN